MNTMQTSAEIGLSGATCNLQQLAEDYIQKKAAAINANAELSEAKA